MVEELAKDREEAVERRRQAVVRRHVGDEQALRQAGNGRTAVGGLGRGRQVAERGDVVIDAGKRVDTENAVGASERGAGIIRGAVDAVRARQRVVLIARAECAKSPLLCRERGGVAAHEDVVRGAENAVHTSRRDFIGGGHGRRAIGVLAGDQQADRARLRVHDQAVGLRIGRAGLCVPDQRSGQCRERLERRAEGGPGCRKVVVDAVHLAQAERQQGIDRHLAGFRHLDLGQNVVEIEAGELDGHEEDILGLIFFDADAHNYSRLLQRNR